MGDNADARVEGERDISGRKYILLQRKAIEVEDFEWFGELERKEF